jgi:hypothetical protein
MMRSDDLHPGCSDYRYYSLLDEMADAVRTGRIVEELTDWARRRFALSSENAAGLIWLM